MSLSDKIRNRRTDGSRSGGLAGAVYASLLLVSPLQLGAQPVNPLSGHKISFTNEVAPILVQKCIGCHNPDKAKGGLQLHAFDRLRQGGESKRPAIVPREPGKSELYRRITTTDADDRMPQKDDPLPAAEIATIERWIAEGARFDGPDPKAALMTLVPEEDNPSPPRFYPRPVPIQAAAFSADGNELATSGYHEVLVWNPTDARLICRIPGLPQRIQNLSYSPDGAWLALGGGAPGRSGEVVLVDARQHTVSRHLGRTSDTVLAVCFSPDGRRLATGGADNSIRIYAVPGGQELLVIQQHADWVMALAFNPTGALLASASRDRTARIYDAKTGELEATYTEHLAPVSAVAFCEDGKLVYSAGRDKRIHVWSPADGKKSAEIGGFDGEVDRLIAQGGRVFSCSDTDGVREYQSSDRKLLRSLTDGRELVYALAYHAPTKRLAAGTDDGRVSVWNAENGELLAAFKAFPAAPTTENQNARIK
jgi:hypothetical protein